MSIRCQIHGVDEPDLDGDFWACGECWHVWRSEADLLADLNARYAEFNSGLSSINTFNAARYPTCPLCAHDW